MVEHKPMSTAEREVVTREYAKVFCEKRAKGYAKGISNYFEADDGIIVTFEKPRIQTTFWFGEHNYEDRREEAREASRSVDFFVSENMNNLQSYARRMDGPSYMTYRYPYIKRGAYYTQPDDCMLGYIWFGSCLGEDDHRGKLEENGFRKLTDSEVSRLREAEARRDALFVKRLNAYLKRYGLSKVRCSTYWADR